MQLKFTFDEDADGPIYVYYELENYYQNHRRYVSSRDPYQLEGEVWEFRSRNMLSRKKSRCLL